MFFFFTDVQESKVWIYFNVNGVYEANIKAQISRAVAAFRALLKHYATWPMK